MNSCASVLNDRCGILLVLHTMRPLTWTKHQSRGRRGPGGRPPPRPPPRRRSRRPWHWCRSPCQRCGTGVGTGRSATHDQGVGHRRKLPACLLVFWRRLRRDTNSLYRGSPQACVCVYVCAHSHTHLENHDRGDGARWRAAERLAVRAEVGVRALLQQAGARGMVRSPRNCVMPSARVTALQARPGLA